MWECTGNTMAMNVVPRNEETNSHSRTVKTNHCFWYASFPHTWVMIKTFEVFFWSDAAEPIIFLTPKSRKKGIKRSKKMIMYKMLTDGIAMGGKLCLQESPFELRENLPTRRNPVFESASSRCPATDSSFEVSWSPIKDNQVMIDTFGEPAWSPESFAYQTPLHSANGCNPFYT